jgi:hypothetical protein
MCPCDSIKVHHFTSSIQLVLCKSSSQSDLILKTKNITENVSRYVLCGQTLKSVLIVRRASLINRIHKVVVVVSALMPPILKTFISIHLFMIQSDFLSTSSRQRARYTCTVMTKPPYILQVHQKPHYRYWCRIHIFLSRELFLVSTQIIAPPAAPCTIKHDTPLCTKTQSLASSSSSSSPSPSCLIWFEASQPPPPACPFRMMPLRDFMGTDPAPDRLPAAKYGVGAPSPPYQSSIDTHISCRPLTKVSTFSSRDGSTGVMMYRACLEGSAARTIPNPTHLQASGAFVTLKGPPWKPPRVPPPPMHSPTTVPSSALSTWPGGTDDRMKRTWSVVSGTA